MLLLLLIAALVAMGAGGNSLYLGPDLPVSEIRVAAELKRAKAVAISVVSPPNPATDTMVSELRSELASGCRLWIGGAGGRRLEAREGVEHIDSLVELEQQVALVSTR